MGAQVVNHCSRGRWYPARWCPGPLGRRRRWARWGA